MNDLTTMAAPEAPLSTREEELLKRLEAAIEEHLKGFKIVGQALTIIRDERLYRIEYDTFEEYCAVEWEISRPRAYQLTQCYMVLNNLSTMVDISGSPKFSILPENERQTRPLTILPMEQHGEVWSMVIEEAEKQEAKITGTFIERCISLLSERKVKARLKNTTRKAQDSQLPDNIRASFNSFLTEVQLSRDLTLDPRKKKEIAVMLREALEIFEQ
jgi:hypothetical protein